MKCSFKRRSARVLDTPTADLCDADGATSHADPEAVHAGVYQVLGLGRRHHVTADHLSEVRSPGSGHKWGTGSRDGTRSEIS